MNANDRLSIEQQRQRAYQDGQRVGTVIWIVLGGIFIAMLLILATGG
jgi:hypothetical protein